MRLRWYLDRIGRMSAGEIVSRMGVAARQRWWLSPRRRPEGLRHLLPGPRAAAVALPRPAPAAVPTAAAAATVAAAEELLAGRWPIFHLRPASVGSRPDWHRDPASGIASSPDTYAFAVPYWDEAQVGNAKYVWELSRHQATTVLAAAWWLTGDDRFAERARDHLTDWWAANPFLCGMHWTGGIEAGLRLISAVWIRALLAEWSGVRSLFDDNDAFVAQLRHHLIYLRRLHSRGSSSNNHLLAELAGVVAATDAFPWFRESAAWNAWARTGLSREAEAQTHSDGFNREQASEYGGFVFEILAATALAVRLAGRPALDRVEAVTGRMADAIAASLDAAGRPPRFGDGDDGRGALLDAPEVPAERVVLDVASAMTGPAAWWPTMPSTVLGAVARLICGVDAPPRDATRPDHFAGVGMTLLRTGAGSSEIYVRCDAGPHGYLSIAAHGHADALSIEVRQGGVEILADPGTYCYHGEPEWRSYFRGTLGHNTLCVEDEDQARIGGPFLWLDKPVTTLSGHDRTGPVLSWSAHHDGYRRLHGVTHHRSVALNQARRTVDVEDWIEAGAAHRVALAFHLGPSVGAVLEGSSATLRWPGGSAQLRLPPTLAWRAYRGETDPPLGWYSPGFGRRVPAWTLVGRGLLPPMARVRSTLDFSPAKKATTPCELTSAAS